LKHIFLYISQILKFLLLKEVEV